MGNAVEESADEKLDVLLEKAWRQQCEQGLSCEREEACYDKKELR